MKPFDRLGSTTDDMDNSMKTQSQEHIIQYKDPRSLKIHKDVTFSVQKDASDDEDLEIARMPHHDPTHNHPSAYVTAR